MGNSKITSPASEARATAPDAPLVPAVVRAVRVLTVLVERIDGATLSEIARDAELSPSTTSNLLHTMAAEALVRFDPATRRYNLGSQLLLFGSVAASRTAPLAEAIPHMRRIAADTGLACLAILRTRDGEFLAVEKVESRRDIKVTIEVGERFPTDAPALDRLWSAWTPRGERGPAGANVQPTTAYTQNTLTNPTDTMREEKATRAQGYASVHGEYVANLNVVGVPVFGRDQLPVLGIMVLGMGDDLSADKVALIAELLIAAARQVTVDSGGVVPDDYPPAPRPG